MARLILVGASGFIGRALRRHLAAEGEEVVCVGRREGRSLPGEEWAVVDLLAAPASELAKLVRGREVRAVINCAGLLEGPVDQMVRANAELPARLVEAVAGDRPRLVHLGSAAEYGEREPDISIDEEDSPRPQTPYGITKLAGTLIVADAAGRRTADAVVLRLFNPLGPGMTVSSMPGRAARLITEASRSGAGSIRMGPLDAWRDFVDVRDVASALLAAVLAPEVSEPILNLGSGRARQARDVVRAMAHAAGWDGEVIEQADLGSPRSDGVSWQQASTARIRAQLGWQPRFGLMAAATSVLAELEGPKISAPAQG
jgi:nucleoside-diphosphate-sugar epimerase